MARFERASSSFAEQLLVQAVETGRLERFLRRQRRRWASVVDPDDFEDMVLRRAWDARDSFQGSSEAALYTWLARIAWRVGIDAWRSQRRQEAHLRRSALRRLFAIRQATNEVETRDLVSWLMNGLNEQERFVLKQRYFKDLSTAEIARKLGRTAEAVHQLHYRAISKLRKLAVDDEKFVKPHPSDTS